jgi:hypothetical protein
MSFAPKQFRGLVTSVLEMFGQKVNSSSFFSEAAVELLMLTAAQETHLGKYLWQIRGPALGVFQMEPNTYLDIWGNWIMYRQSYLNALNDLWGASGLDWTLRMKADLAYQIVMSRIFYMRIPAPIPAATDPISLAHYWKKYYNTVYGKGTPEEAYNNYSIYALK